MVMGKNKRLVVCIRDHCKGIDLVYHKGKKGETYNVGGRNERTNLQIVDRICTILGPTSSTTLIFHIKVLLLCRR